jgi:hypothetical protein
MRNLKLDLFEFRKSLTLEQEQDEVSRIVENHYNIYDRVSEKRLVESLSRELDPHTCDPIIKALVESINAEIKENSLHYELKDLYKKIEVKNQGMVYRHPMNVLLNIINESDDREQTSKIINELALYDWVPEIKVFMLNYTTNPMQRANLSSEGGKAETVFSAIEPVSEGHVAFIKNAWFLLSEKNIEKTTLDKWISDNTKLRRLNLIQKALEISEVSEERINFKIDENLTVGVSTKDGSLWINDSKADKETTLDNLFSSPIVPFLKRDFYPVIAETINNIDKFVELDFVTKITNVTNPHLEAYAFNYKDEMYVYADDKRYGTSFYKHDSAMSIVNEMKSQLGLDLTYFFKNKFSKEIIAKKGLEDKEKVIIAKIDECATNIEKIDAIEVLKTSAELQAAKQMLISEKAKLEISLKSLRTDLKSDKYRIA